MDLNVPFLIAGPILRKATRDELCVVSHKWRKIEGYFELSGNHGFLYRDNFTSKSSNTGGGTLLHYPRTF